MQAWFTVSSSAIPMCLTGVMPKPSNLSSSLLTTDSLREKGKVHDLKYKVLLGDLHVK